MPSNIGSVRNIVEIGKLMGSLITSPATSPTIDPALPPTARGRLGRACAADARSAGQVANDRSPLPPSNVGAQPLTVHTFSDIDPIFDEWERVWARDPFATAFTHPAWHRSYLSAHSGVEPILIVLRSPSGALAGVCPLMRQRGRLCFLSTPRADFMRPTLDPEGDPELAVDLLLKAARRAAGGATIELSPFHPDDPLADLFAARARAASLSVAAYDAGPSLRLTDLIEPHAIRRKFEGSRHIRRHLSKLRGQGEYAYERIESRSEMLAELPRLFAFQTRRWSGAGNQIFLNPQVQQFYREIVARYPAENLWFTRLKLQGRVVALSLDFEVRGVFQHYKRVFDVERAVDRPGLALLCELGRDIGRRGLHTLDFGRGKRSYMLRFANHIRERRAVVVYPGRLARAFDGYVSGAARFLRLRMARSPQFAARHRIKDRLHLLHAAIDRHGVRGAAARGFRQAMARTRRTALFELPSSLRETSAESGGLNFRFGALTDLLDVLDLQNRIDRSGQFQKMAERLKRGDQLVLGHAAGRLVFSGWLARSAPGGAAERRRSLKSGDGVMLIHDCFTARDTPRLHVFTGALAWAATRRNHGERALVACAADDETSISAIRQAGCVAAGGCWGAA